MTGVSSDDPFSDRKVLRAFARDRSSSSYLVFVERYLPFVYGAARRQLGADILAEEATRGVFLAAAKRARKLSRDKTILSWLHRATSVGVKRLKRGRGTAQPIETAESPAPESVKGLAEWEAVLPFLDAQVDAIPPRPREALLQYLFSGGVPTQLAENHRARVSFEKRLDKGSNKLSKRLRKRRVPFQPDQFASLAGALRGLYIPPVELAAQIASDAGTPNQNGAALKLARRVLSGLAWIRWKRRFKIAGALAGVFLLLFASVAAYLASLWQSGELMPRIIEWSSALQAREIPKESRNARPWPTGSTQPVASLATVRNRADFYQITNIWMTHLSFSSDQWQALSPKHVQPVQQIMKSDGKLALRNPKAKRSGLAGALGYDFDWAHANLELSAVIRRNVAVRFKGNGTYIGSLYGSKRPFKVNLGHFEEQESIVGVEELNLTNLIEDRSYMSDALAYELFRLAGVPAPRTAYSWLKVSVAGMWSEKPLGLYLLVEPLDTDFATDHFGTEKTPIFKPVTYDLFQYWGDEYAAYKEVYDLKTKASRQQKQRLIDFARLVTKADDTEFASRLGDYLDLDEFARFLATLVLLSSYDGFLFNGQNFYVYLDPRSEKFGFIPWDLDHAWGGFPFIGTAEQREQASIFHPWVGENRFLQRVMAVEQFRKQYRAVLEELLVSNFTTARLFERIDEVARVIRSPIGAESAFRLERFDQAVSDKWLDGSREGDATGPRRPVHQLKRFITNRVISVREQLDGKSKGVVLKGVQPNRK